MSIQIEVEHLTKTFGPRRVVDDVTFAVRPGRVTGFLGPNGSGKTTTLRMAVGLVRPTTGTVRFGARPFTALADPGRVVGALLDASGAHPGRRALDHLRIALVSRGIDPRGAEGLLDRVGLAAHGHERVGTYSLGMRQRLGLATALAGDPAVLLLDEPANGLDPGGLAWLRELLRAFAADGRTVLLASHVLSEIVQVADDLVVIDSGRIRFAGPRAELGDTASTLEAAFLRLTTADAA